MKTRKNIRNLTRSNLDIPLV